MRIISGMCYSMRVLESCDAMYFDGVLAKNIIDLMHYIFIMKGYRTMLHCETARTRLLS